MWITYRAINLSSRRYATQDWVPITGLWVGSSTTELRSVYKRRLFESVLNYRGDSALVNWRSTSTITERFEACDRQSKRLLMCQKHEVFYPGLWSFKSLSDGASWSPVNWCRITSIVKYAFKQSSFVDWA